MKRRGFTAWDVFWLVLAALYFLVPLVGTAQFSLQTGSTTYGFAAYAKTLQDPAFQDTP